MKPDWLIQTNMDGVDVDVLIQAITKCGMNVWPIEYKIGHFIDFSIYDQDACILCYGDIGFVQQVRRFARFIPGAWANFNNLKCSTYYAYFGQFLLNQHYIILPIGDLLRRWDDLIQVHDSWFIRPDSGTKLFTGYVVKSYEWHKIELLLNAIGPETLIVVAPEQIIHKEWRFVVCDREIVAGCQYLPIESPIYPDPVFCLADSIAKQEWRPDICYTIDIAETEDSLGLLEINSFSAAGFYCCNIGNIVTNASQAAINEWNGYVV